MSMTSALEVSIQAVSPVSAAPVVAEVTTGAGAVAVCANPA
ncbi:MAG TPA: hypothetical protein VHQ47_10485 [Phycisphaerae bacterium]|nr:hypothetical protein [Phycisphaerae bacterium]